MRSSSDQELGEALAQQLEGGATSEVPLALPGETPPNSARAVNGPDVYRSTTKGCSQAWAREVTSIPRGPTRPFINWPAPPPTTAARSRARPAAATWFLSTERRRLKIAKVPHGHPMISSYGVLKRPERNRRPLSDTNRQQITRGSKLRPRPAHAWSASHSPFLTQAAYLAPPPALLASSSFCSLPQGCELDAQTVLWCACARRFRASRRGVLGGCEVAD